MGIGRRRERTQAVDRAQVVLQMLALEWLELTPAQKESIELNGFELKALEAVRGKVQAVR